MAVELATAYVSIVPTTKGIEGKLAEELAPLSTAAGKAGTDSGKALGSSFTGASGGLKASLETAKGHFTGFKSSAVDSLKAVGVSSSMLSTAGTAAIVGFAFKSVQKFAETSKAALDLSSAVGVNVEDASRWIAVADDYGLSADTLQGSLGKVSKTLDDTKWKEFGVATRDAGGEVRPVNDILLDTFDKLSAITNEGDRAREGAKLFGKGYGAIAPLVGHTREEYEKMLGAVDRGQVITADEAVKAEKWRMAMDSLKDAFGRFEIAVGEVIAGLAPLISGISTVIQKVLDYRDALDRATEGTSFDGFFGGIGDTFAGVGNAFTDFKGKVLDVFEYGPFAKNVPDRYKDATAAANDLADANVNLQGDMINSQNSAAGYSYAVADMARHDTDAAIVLAANAANSERAVKASIDAMIAKWKELTQPVEDDQAWINLETSFNKVHDAAVEAFTAAAEKSDDAEQKGLDYQTKINDIRLGVIDYGKEVLGLPPEKLTNILMAVDQGKFDQAEAMLAILTRNRTMVISIQAKGGAGYSDDKTFAAGGYTPGGVVMVGEHGRELVDLPKGSFVHDAADTRSIMRSMSMSAPQSWTPQISYGAPVTLVIQGLTDRRYVKELATAIDNIRREGL
jgi:hypothetical protein